MTPEEMAAICIPVGLVPDAVLDFTRKHVAAKIRAAVAEAEAPLRARLALAEAVVTAIKESARTVEQGNLIKALEAFDAAKEPKIGVHFSGTQQWQGDAGVGPHHPLNMPMPPPKDREPPLDFGREEFEAIKSLGDTVPDDHDRDAEEE